MRRRDPHDAAEEDRTDAPAGLFLSRRGNWFHDGQRVMHDRLEALLTGAIARAADGSLIVTTGRDVLPFVAEDAPFFITSVDAAEGVVTLSDGSRERLVGPVVVGSDDRLRAPVKQGAFWALFTRAAGQMLEPYLEEAAIAFPSSTIPLSTAAATRLSDPPGEAFRSLASRA